MLVEVFLRIGADDEAVVVDVDVVDELVDRRVLLVLGCEAQQVLVDRFDVR